MSAGVVRTMSKEHTEEVEDVNSTVEKTRPPPVIVTEADNKRIRRKTDLVILSCLVLTYFLQTRLSFRFPFSSRQAKAHIFVYSGLTAVYGLREDTGLSGDDYSQIGAIGYYAQLGAQPLAAYLIVRLRYRIFVPAIIVLWSASLLGLAGSTNYQGLMASRFFLGFFEAAAIPCFSVLTISFWRRSEQPLRVAAWYGTNGMANLIASPIVFGMSRAKSSTLDTYQAVYLLFGLWSFCVGVASYWWLSDSPATASFLTPEDRVKAVERLKANNQGIVSQKFNIKHALEAFTDIKLYLFMIMTFCANAGASASNVFGPIILQNLIGFSADNAVLLNMPFGALQTIVILLSSWAAVRFKHKAPVIIIVCLPVIAGLAILYAVPKTPENQRTLLGGYYLFGFLFSFNPLILSWMGANLAGQTKKSTCYTTFNFASAIGNIVAPYLFKAKDAPNYKPALEAILIFFIVLAVCTVLQAFNLIWAQRRKEKKRVQMGLPAKIADHSMSVKFEQDGEQDVQHREPDGVDETDHENPWFTYVW